MTLNTVIIGGNLTRDPELKYSEKGAAVCRFSIAHNDAKGNASFFNCVAFNKTAENMTQYQKKGSSVTVEGSLSQNSYELDDGTKKSTVEILAFKVHFAPKGKAQESAVSSVDVSSIDDIADDEVPF